MGLKELTLNGATQEIFSVLSLAPAKSTMIQNKTGGRIIVYPSDTAPPANQEYEVGFFVRSGETIVIPPNSASKCYVTGNNGAIAVLNY